MVEHIGTPSDTSPTRKRARTLDVSSHPDSTRTSQRVRTTSSKASEKEIQIQLPDVTFERRRVNPESLALRLGPELVSDLDALVPPGSRDMPSFAARKQLQERHKVDRRHIYDYYHSKGLRVVKEDKHGNPIKQTEPAPVIPQSTRRQLRPPAPKALASVCSPLSGSSDIKPKPSKRQCKPHTTKPNVARSNCKKSGPSNPPIHTHKYSSPQEQNTEQPPSHQTQINYYQPQFSRSDSPRFLTQNWPPSTQTLEHYGTDFDVDDFHFYPSIDHRIAPQLGPSKDNIVSSASSQAIFDSVIESLDFEIDLGYSSPGVTASQTAFAVPENDNSSSGISLDSMTPKEAVNFYDLLDSVLGPAVGIQESVGTYKSYMAEQRQLYFERLLPESQYHMRKVRAQTYVNSQSMDQRPAHTSVVDFRKWIASDLSADIPLNIRHSPSLRNDSTSACTQRRRSSTLLHLDTIDPETSRIFLKQSDGPSYLPTTLDDLFPSVNKPVYSAEENLGSPIQRTIVEDHLSSASNDAVHAMLVLDLDSPSVSQMSPDVQSSPLIQTPSLVYRQFIQRKSPAFDQQQWNNTYHGGEHHSLLQENGMNGEIGVQHLGSGSSDAKLLTYSRARTASSGFVITRTRVTSAGGGI